MHSLQFHAFSPRWLRPARSQATKPCDHAFGISWALLHRSGMGAATPLRVPSRQRRNTEAPKRTPTPRRQGRTISHQVAVGHSACGDDIGHSVPGAFCRPDEMASAAVWGGAERRKILRSRAIDVVTGVRGGGCAVSCAPPAFHGRVPDGRCLSRRAVALYAYNDHFYCDQYWAVWRWGAGGLAGRLQPNVPAHRETARISRTG